MPDPHPLEFDELATGSVSTVFGTRPEIIKLSGIIDALGDHAWTIFSGQHFDQLLSQIFFEELHLEPPDVMLAVGGRTRGQQIADLVLRLEECFVDRRPAAVVVQGDTNTALGGALTANALEIPLAHVEAGLRSFDRNMPEEHNRIAVDHLADLCLAPTEQARKNLLEEGIPGERIAVTGNTVVEAATRLLPAPAERVALLGRMGLQAGRFILATFHRPENVDDPTQLGSLLEHIAELDAPVVFPVHPRTRRRIVDFGLSAHLGHVSLLDPMPYSTFLALASECAFLLSDSGGVQEEASIVKRPAIILRKSSDRPEVLGTFTELVSTVADVLPAARALLADLDDLHRRLARMPTPYGDGRASERSVEHIELLARDPGRFRTRPRR
jgi:UDP-N-acetylglucosamine 2-epimerase (non-hydrolysing)